MRSKISKDDLEDKYIEKLEIVESEYQGRKVKLNDPFRLPSGSKKKFGVYVKNEKGNVVKVTFGDPNMEIKRDDPGRLKSFRARHNCDNPGFQRQKHDTGVVFSGEKVQRLIIRKSYDNI